MTARKSYVDDDSEVAELDEDWFAEARPASELPIVAEALRRAGRPSMPAEARKVRVTMYLDPDLLERLKAGGKGWQTRANAMLRQALEVG